MWYSSIKWNIFYTTVKYNLSGSCTPTYIVSITWCEKKTFFFKFICDKYKCLYVYSYIFMYVHIIEYVWGNLNHNFKRNACSVVLLWLLTYRYVFVNIYMYINMYSELQYIAWSKWKQLISIIIHLILYWLLPMINLPITLNNYLWQLKCMKPFD